MEKKQEHRTVGAINSTAFAALVNQRELRDKLGNLCVKNGIDETDLYALIERKRLKGGE